MMGKRARVAAVGAILAALAIASGCSSSSSSGSPGNGPTATFGPVAEHPGTTPPPTSSPMTRTTSTTIMTTTIVPIPPEASGYALELYDAWTKGNRPAANQVAEPAAASAMFAVPYRKADGWTYKGCSGAAGSTYCTAKNTAGKTITIRVNNQAVGGLHAVDSVTVSG